VGQSWGNPASPGTGEDSRWFLDATAWTCALPSSKLAAVKYDRTVIAYHGCDTKTAERILSGDPFKRSENDYDWLGAGIYFWEFGYDRAFRFAEQERKRGRIKKPAVVGAILQLGNCFDLMDTKFTDDLSVAFEMFKTLREAMGRPLPVNSGKTPDKKLRHLDCAVLNLYFKRLEEKGERYDTVRCGFVEGPAAFEGSGIRHQSHVQVAVRNPACVLGTFRPR
jgi:hypothetical protein